MRDGHQIFGTDGNGRMPGDPYQLLSMFSPTS